MANDPLFICPPEPVTYWTVVPSNMTTSIPVYELKPSWVRVGRWRRDVESR